MKLIRATNEDAQTLLDIEKTACGRKTYSGYFTKEEILEWLENEIVYLIEKAGQIAGSISYEIKSPAHVHISGLVILPEFQKQALAKKAIEKLLVELAGYEKIDLVTHPDNLLAIRLYESLGFVETGCQKNFFGDGEPRIIMVRMPS